MPAQSSLGLGSGQVRETVRDVTFLHSEQFFAAAQKKYVYIYDKRGLEVHCLKVRAAGKSALRMLPPAHCLQLKAGAGVAVTACIGVMVEDMRCGSE